MKKLLIAIAMLFVGVAVSANDVLTTIIHEDAIVAVDTANPTDTFVAYYNTANDPNYTYYWASVRAYDIDTVLANDSLKFYLYTAPSLAGPWDLWDSSIVVLSADSIGGTQGVELDRVNIDSTVYYGSKFKFQLIHAFDLDNDSDDSVFWGSRAGTEFPTTIKCFLEGR
jgi:hypothetical protein